MCENARIRDLVQAKLAGRKIDVVGFIDDLLDLAKEVGAIRCYLAVDEGMWFELRDQKTYKVEIDGCRGKLRMLCARLATLCNEAGSLVSPYGGEGCVRAPTNNGTDSASWTIRFKNTPGEHEFTIIPAMIEKPQVVPAGR